MRSLHVIALVSILAVLVPAPGAAAADEQVNWPQFRGPTGEGKTECDKLPLTWSEDKNIVWKTPIEGTACGGR